MPSLIPLGSSFHEAFTLALSAIGKGRAQPRREPSTEKKEPPSGKPVEKTRPERVFKPVPSTRPLPVEFRVPVVFRRWLGTVQGLQFKEKLGVNFETFARNFSERVKPAQQDMFVLYMQGVMDTGEQIANVVNNRNGLVAGANALSATQVQDALLNKGSTLNTTLNKSTKGAFLNTKQLRDAVGYGHSTSLTRFLLSPQAQVVAEKLGAKSFQEFKENIALKLNPIEQKVLSMYLGGEHTYVEIAQAINTQFGLNGTKWEKDEASIKNMVQKPSSLINSALFDRHTTIVALLPKRGISPLNAFGDSPEFAIFLRSKRGAALFSELRKNGSAEKFKELVRTHFSHRQQAVLSIFLGSGLTDGEVVGRVNLAYPPSEKETRLTLTSMKSVLTNKSGVSGKILAALPNGWSFAELRKQLKTKWPAEPLLAEKRAPSPTVTETSPFAVGMQRDLGTWLSSNPDGINLHLIQSGYAQINADQIRNKLTEQEQYALYVYLSSTNSMQAVLQKTQAHYGTAFKEIPLSKLKEKVAQILFKIRSKDDNFSSTWASAEKLRAGNHRTEIAPSGKVVERVISMFESTSRSNDGGASFERMKTTIGSEHVAYLTYLQQNLTQSKQYLLALVLEGKLTMKQCTDLTNQRFSLTGTTNVLTEDILSNLMAPSSEASKKLNTISNGKLPSLRALRAVLVAEK
jgi:hypothetical protein